MRTIKLQKSPASAILAALLVGLLMAIIAIVAPFRDPSVSWHLFWLSAWDYGFAAHGGNGPKGIFNFTSRLANIRAWGSYQPFL